MKKSSLFSLADLLTLLVSVTFGFFCFLSLNFLSEGELFSSAMIASVIVLVLGGLAWLVKYQKTVRQRLIHAIMEFLLAIVFSALFFIVGMTCFAHYFTVSSKKEEIKNTLESSISRASKMFDDYEAYAKDRELIYTSNLESVIASKVTRPSDYHDYGFGTAGISDEVQMENKIFTLHADLFPTNYTDTVSFNGIKDVASKWLQDQNNVVSLWKPIGIPIVANDISAKASEWRDELIGYSSVREKGEVAQDFSYNLSFDSISSLLTTTDAPNPLPVFLSIIIWVLMLFSWIITPQNPRWPGWKRVLGRANDLDNEL